MQEILRYAQDDNVQAQHDNLLGFWAPIAHPPMYDISILGSFSVAAERSSE